jgi:hypothetical protein
MGVATSLRMTRTTFFGFIFTYAALEHLRTYGWPITYLMGGSASGFSPSFGGPCFGVILLEGGLGSQNVPSGVPKPAPRAELTHGMF